MEIYKIKIFVLAFLRTVYPKVKIVNCFQIKSFLTKAGALACKRINGEKVLKGAFIKFEALDRLVICESFLTCIILF